MAASSASTAVADSIWREIKSSRSGLIFPLPLHLLFGKNLERATIIVDEGGVQKHTGNPSGRFIFKVVGNSKKKTKYICFPEHFCTCYSFFHDVVSKGEQLCCKHQIAFKLAEAAGMCKEVSITDEKLAEILSEI
ncbi:hypothetical protein MA16_Dca012184 [Dendrobium catenatum]|uniref:SWIM-type domain-containing protein n=1 Tax=Dendrobium catenatum TaxID=906689 RepID=A0A2I0VPX6_9ASPA|nr:hypothetical protein MA16_Dca012184 [Dendrobium catenatum]